MIQLLLSMLMPRMKKAEDDIVAANNAISQKLDKSGGEMTGSMGFGTDTPTAPLSFGRDDEGEIGRISFDVLGVQRAFIAADYHTATGQLVDVVLGTGGAERVRITSGGWVGIGTDDPAGPLDVKSASYPGLHIDRTLGGASAGIQLVNSVDGTGWRINASGTLVFVRDHNGGPAAVATMTADSDMIVAGNVSGGSDERHKTNWRALQPDYVDQLAALLSGIYDRTDITLTQVGVGAQSLREFLPAAIIEGDDSYLSVAYGNAAMVSAVELAKRVVEQDRRIQALEERIEMMRQL